MKVSTFLIFEMLKYFDKSWATNNLLNILASSQVVLSTASIASTATSGKLG